MSRRPISQSSRFDESNDPALLRRRRLLALQQARTSAANTSAAGTSEDSMPVHNSNSKGHSPPEADGPADSDEHSEQVVDTASRRRARTPDADLEEIGTAYKRQKKLTAESEADLLSFCKGGAGAEGRRQVIALGITLEVRDLLRSMERESDGIDGAMKTIIRHHCKMFIFSPDLTVYRGSKEGELSKAVLDAMRKLKIKGIPPAKNAAKVATFVSVIGREMTNYRHTIKVAMEHSVVGEDAPCRNIAALTHSLCPDGSSVTLSHYMRMSFIRWHIVNYPDLAPDAFWLRIDQTIRKNFKQGVAFANEYFEDTYNEDKEEYGSPEDSDESIVSVTERSPDQVAIERLATLVKMRPVAASAKSSERASVELGEDDDGEGLDNGGDPAQENADG